MNPSAQWRCVPYQERQVNSTCSAVYDGPLKVSKGGLTWFGLDRVPDTNGIQLLELGSFTLISKTLVPLLIQKFACYSKIFNFHNTSLVVSPSWMMLSHCFALLQKRLSRGSWKWSSIFEVLNWHLPSTNDHKRFLEHCLRKHPVPEMNAVHPP